ncbi:MAG: hypothetical protein U9R51_09900 [Actinomycetota bacterium]|nr:hypothetical protein [Actinomycetota bacterium]
MKRITLTIDVEADGSRLGWALDDWRGMVTTGESVDSVQRLIVLWGGDIERLLDDASYRGSNALEL